MELSKEDYKKWIVPIVIDNEDAAIRFIDAIERAAAHKPKKIDVKYKEITDAIEIKKMFGVDENGK